MNEASPARRRIGRVARRAVGRTVWQPVIHHLHRLALAGMNIGASDVLSSGERGVLMSLTRSQRPASPCVFDVGANVGTYSRSVIDVLGPHVELHALEPSPTAFALLSQTLKDSPTGVRLHNVGLDRADRVVDLHSPELGSPLASVYHRHLSHVGLESPVVEPCRMRRLDAFAQDEGIVSIDLLKLDVEGNELAALEGAGKMLQTGAIKMIQFEFGGANIDSRTYLRDFFEMLTPRYLIHRILQNGIARQDKYREADEIFVTTNFLATWQGPA
jgi:FkbM family methyltransferase